MAVTPPAADVAIRSFAAGDRDAAVALLDSDPWRRSATRGRTGSAPRTPLGGARIVAVAWRRGRPGAGRPRFLGGDYLGCAAWPRRRAGGARRRCSPSRDGGLRARARNFFVCVSTSTTARAASTRGTATRTWARCPTCSCAAARAAPAEEQRAGPRSRVTGLTTRARPAARWCARARRPRRRSPDRAASGRADRRVPSRQRRGFRRRREPDRVRRRAPCGAEALRGPHPESHISPDRPGRTRADGAGWKQVARGAARARQLAGEEMLASFGRRTAASPRNGGPRRGRPDRCARRHAPRGRGDHPRAADRAGDWSSGTARDGSPRA